MTFLVSGLWHGANWTFIVWGAIHGVAQAFENILMRGKQFKKTGVCWALRTLFVFCFICITWIFFVSNSLDDALYVITHLFSGLKNPIAYLKKGVYAINILTPNLIYSVISIALLAIYDYFSLKTDVINSISNRSKPIRWTVYILILILIILSIPATKTSEFIYFQF